MNLEPYWVLIFNLITPFQYQSIKCHVWNHLTIISERTGSWASSEIEKKRNKTRQINQFDEIFKKPNRKTKKIRLTILGSQSLLGTVRKIRIHFWILCVWQRLLRIEIIIAGNGNQFHENLRENDFTEIGNADQRCAGCLARRPFVIATIYTTVWILNWLTKSS